MVAFKYLKHGHQGPQKAVKIFSITLHLPGGLVFFAELAAKQIHSKYTWEKYSDDELS